MRKIEEEKKAWMDKVGIIELKKPFKYHCYLGDNAITKEMYYTEDYIKNTPLEELKEGFNKNFK